MMLDLDHSIIRSKCLWMLYKILHLFPSQEREDIIMEFFEAHFYEYTLSVVFLTISFFLCYSIQVLLPLVMERAHADQLSAPLLGVPTLHRVDREAGFEPSRTTTQLALLNVWIFRNAI